MTKEELEKEAEKYRLSLVAKLRPKLQEGCNCKELVDIEKAYLAGAEPREKQIQIDAEQIRALQKQNGELTDKVRELEKLSKAKELLRDVLPYIDLTDCVNSDPRLILYDKIKSLIKEIEK